MLMWSHMWRGIVFSCLVIALGVGAAACGALPGSGSADAGYHLTRCDGSAATTTSSASAALSSIYAGSVGGKLYAFSPERGVTRWCDHFTVARTYTCPPDGHCPAPPQAVVGKPLVEGGVLYVCVSGIAGYTFALNANDGSIRWMRQTSCMVSSIPFADYAAPVLANGTLFSGAYALDPRDGSARRRLSNNVVPGVVADGALYGYTQDTVFASDAQSGKQIWSYPLPDLIGSAPAVANGVVYVGDIGGDSPPAATPDQPDTFALDARTGKLLWRAPTGIASGSPVVAGGVVYVGGFGPAMFAIDAAHGHIIWRDSVTSARPSTPIVRDGVVYFTADGVYAVDATTGRLRWREPLGASQSTWFTDLSMAQGALYFVRTDGSGMSTLYALNASDGAILWRHDGLAQMSPPVALG